MMTTPKPSRPKSSTVIHVGDGSWPADIELSTGAPVRVPFGVTRPPWTRFLMGRGREGTDWSPVGWSFSLVGMIWRIRAPAVVRT